MDFRGRVTLPMIGNYLIHAASSHAGERGFGFNDMSERHTAWVLSRLAIEMKEYPTAFDKINLYTWIDEVGRLFTSRCFELADENGKTFGFARSIWAAIDVETRRPTLLDIEALGKYIDEPRAEALLNAARDAGVNYFDTAYPYHGGESEPFVGRVIAKWPRESFYLATKLPLWQCKSLDEAKRVFADQQKRLGVDYFDFYLMHSLHKARYDEAKALGIVDWLWEQKAAGTIRSLGFSCHDHSAGFEHILRDQPWDFCQLQYNYLDTDDRAEEISGDRGYQLTEELGVPLIIMEPIKGGTLATLPPDAEAPLKALRPEASAASWALRWVGSHQNVHVILSGMSAEDQLEDNLKTFEHFEPLSPEETQAVEKTAAILHSRIKIGCTGCRYCMPCPMGVDIPDNFSIWNKLSMFGQKDAIKKQWAAHFPDAEKASHCARCGKCEGVCPQKLPIRASLAQLQQELDAL